MSSIFYNSQKLTHKDTCIACLKIEKFLQQHFNAETLKANVIVIGHSFGPEFEHKLQFSFLPTLTFSSHEQIQFKLPSNPLFRRQLQKQRYLAHYDVQLMEITELNRHSTVKFLQKTILFGNPSRTRFVFTGEFSTLEIFLHVPVLNDLKFKFGIAWNGEILFKEKIVTSGFKIKNIFPVLDSNHINLSGRHLKFATAPIPPYITLKHGRITGGSSYLIAVYLSEKYNFTMEVDFNSFHSTGYMKNGFWTGVTGALYYRRADVGLFLGHTLDRYGVVDLTYLIPDIVYFMTREPKNSIKWQAVFYPYTPRTWLLILMTYLTVMTTMFVGMKLANEEHPSRHALFIPLQISLDQGFDIRVPKSIKIITALWMGFVIVISTGYRSDLVSYFSFPDPEKIPLELEALAGREDYKVIFHYHAGTVFHYFNTAKSKVLKDIRERFILERSGAKCAIAAAMEPKSVCISWALVISGAVCGNLTLPGAFKPMVVYSKPVVSFTVGFAFPKNSVLTESFERISGYFRDYGLIEKLNSEVQNNFTKEGKSWMRTQRYEDSFKRIEREWKEKQEKVRPFKLLNFTAVFSILLSALSLSFVVFLVENGIYKWQRLLNTVIFVTTGLFFRGNNDL
ncbi:unnamed protein product [Allacma fusca]|uniref:Uncharacterized protein n=1 Tax=Allacma fusca TaxID=39272 RepID=A0A8J2NJ36_9HEXA|nr:unnamed protein product [Allacma fusca]